MGLEGTSLDQLQMLEFGRGFGYQVPLSISMASVGSTILKQIVSVWCFRLTWTWTLALALTPTLTLALTPIQNLTPVYLQMLVNVDFLHPDLGPVLCIKAPPPAGFSSAYRTRCRTASAAASCVNVRDTRASVVFEDRRGQRCLRHTCFVITVESVC